MQEVFNRSYSIYALLVFTALFILLLPLFLFFILLDDKHKALFFLNRLWAKLFFTLIFIKVETIYEAPLEKHKQYIFCANHFSYLDIPVLGYLKHRAVFVGKSSLAKIPVFGFMFKKIHIMVDRGKLKSRYEALKTSLEVIDKGCSLFIFPEGGIITSTPPDMGRFKDGAFRAAIDKQIPIVPVTIPYNWIILPDDDQYLLHRKNVKIVIHRPLPTAGMSLADVGALKEQTFGIIDQELKKHFLLTDEVSEGRKYQKTSVE